MPNTYQVTNAEIVHGIVRVTLNGDDQWGYNLTKKTFTRRRPGLLTEVWNKKVLGPERVDQFKSRANLMERLGHCKPLIEALDNGILQALLASELKGVA